MIIDTLNLGDSGATVRVLQQRLNRHGAHLTVDHVFGPNTEGAVRAFQRGHDLIADGVVGPATDAALLGRPLSRYLSQTDIEDAARTLACEPAAIIAIMQVETRGNGFLSDGRAKILYERHIMYRLLKAADIDPEPWAARYPNIVNRTPGGYMGGGAEYARLAQAKTINVDCAIQSCSWGRFQIMGEHWQALGYSGPAAFAADMQSSARAQIHAFVAFVGLHDTMHRALREHDWATFARHYNGPDYAEHHYAQRLALAFAQQGGSDQTALAVPQPPPPVDVGGPDLAVTKPRRKRRPAKSSAAKATT